jgi:hypothetical protein
MSNGNGSRPPRSDEDEYDKLLDGLSESDPYGLEKYLDPVEVPPTFEEYLKQRGLWPERVEEFRNDYQRLVSGVVLTDGKVEVEGLNFDGIVEPLPDLSGYEVVPKDEYLGEVEENAMPDAIRQLHPDFLRYENPEALFLEGDQTYRISLRSHWKGRPVIASIHLKKSCLHDALAEALFDLAWRGKDESERITRDEMRVEFWADDETPRAVQYALGFFLRIFPHVMTKAFDIAFKASQLPILRPFVDDPNKREEITRWQLDHDLNDLRDFLKERIRVRSKGRPANVHEGLAGDVWKIALEMMGEKRGKGSAPGLKAIADRLGMTTKNLSGRLRKLGRGWVEVLRPELESLPLSVLAFGYTKRDSP